MYSSLTFRWDTSSLGAARLLDPCITGAKFCLVSCKMTSLSLLSRKHDRLFRLKYWLLSYWSILFRSCISWWIAANRRRILFLWRVDRDHREFLSLFGVEYILKHTEFGVEAFEWRWSPGQLDVVVVVASQEVCCPSNSWCASRSP